MEDLENKLGAILGNPDMMEKIMSLAQNLGANEAASGQHKENPPSPLPELDLSMIQKLSGFAKNSRIDPNQQTLLKALTPYLSNHRIGRLERAMHAAKLANFATAFLNTGR